VAAASFAPDVEEEANSYFQKIYTLQLTIDATVALLLRFKSSAVQREQEVFACMVHNLFDEYRFFGRYPDKELMITGVLFGALIQHQLVSYIPLGIALRYVLEGARLPDSAAAPAP
jgi:CCR4-NOT transcription complex subunit 1